MVRITALAGDIGAGLLAERLVSGGISITKGFIALNMAGCSNVGAALVDIESVTAVFGVAISVVVVFVSSGAAGALDFGRLGDTEGWGALFFTGVATRNSWALKTCKQEPQRTAPLADCSWLGVTRKAVPHFGQRVIIWLLAEVMVYLLLTRGQLVPCPIYYRDLTV